MRPSQHNMTLLIVCECAVLWAFQIIKRASLLQHRFRLSFDRTRRSSPCLMAQNHAPAALLRLSCWCQKGAYRVGGVRFKPCSPPINSIYGFWDVSQVCQVCQIKVFLPGAFLDPQVLSDAESFAPCLIFFFPSSFIISNHIFKMEIALFLSSNVFYRGMHTTYLLHVILKRCNESTTHIVAHSTGLMRWFFFKDCSRRAAIFRHSELR